MLIGVGMELFHMKRYYDEEDEESQNAEESSVKKLKGKIVRKKRKIACNVDDLKEEEDKAIDDDDKGCADSEAMDTSIPSKDDDNNVIKDSLKKARRILPRWLAEPNIISDDLKDDQMLVCDIEGISESLRDKLKNNGIRYLFPVQRQIVPHLLDSSLKHYYRPSDICVSAPTGSGKTLAFVLPIVQALQNRVVPRIRALVILPVQDLALQIYKVFKSYTAGEKLKVILLSSGQGKNVKTEQSELVCKGLGGDNDYHSLVDIIIATPGRLVEHLHNTPGFSLQHLRYLIIDEADKVMEDVSNDWLSQVEAAVYSGVNRRRPGPLTVKKCKYEITTLAKNYYFPLHLVKALKSCRN
ncbi:DDX51 [Lepeophtheirus salmonis]|uniref:ATP-dependent RNA helicase n=1 Tax=Lepeophtheirus salmonis TaxID=72036 RepID=A0A7R8GZM5_LEPSM|nr:DDX51 [Lepeophtheirus salmonis]CAF2766957.1 DDX51 [Lepeophtheirus salmonis]